MFCAFVNPVRCRVTITAQEMLEETLIGCEESHNLKICSELKGNQNYFLLAVGLF